MIALVAAVLPVVPGFVRAAMTPGGQARLREEMKRLKEVEMPQVVKDIGTAREHGDLSENAGYDDAKMQQCADMCDRCAESCERMAQMGAAH